MNPERLKISDSINDAVREKFGIDVVAGFGNVLKGDASLFAEKHPFFLPVHDVCGVRQDGGVLEVESQAVPDTPAEKCVFLFLLEFSSGDRMPQPTGTYTVSINDNASLRICTQHSPCEWETGTIRAQFIPEYTYSSTQNDIIFGCENESISQGVFIVEVPTAILKNSSSATFRFTGQGTSGSSRVLRIFKVRPVLLKTFEYMSLLANGMRKPNAMGKPIFFGDIHNHSGEIKGGEINGCGVGTAEDNYLYARDVSRLDFYGLAEHDYQIKDAEGWRHWEALSKKYNKDGHFVTFPSFEWTSGKYGHRNVHYKSEGGPFFFSREEGSILPDEIWSFLAKSDVSGFTIPHHPSAAPHSFDWSTFNPEFDRLVEIYSSWGSSEVERDSLAGSGTQRISRLSIDNAFKDGLKFGMIGSSDGHDGHPGNSQSPDIKHHHIYHTNGSGRAAVLCDTLSRESVFEALRNRRCYATTGQHIELDFSLNGSCMGTDVPIARDGNYSLETELHGTARIKKLQLISARGIIRSIEVDRLSAMIQETLSLSREDMYIYLKCEQDDNAVAWSSPVWINNGS